MRNSEKCEERGAGRGEPGSTHEEETRRTIGRILGEKRAQEAALRRVPNSGVVERLDEGRRAKHVREIFELRVHRSGCLPSAGEELDPTLPFVRGDAIENGKENGEGRTQEVEDKHVGVGGGDKTNDSAALHARTLSRKQIREVCL